MTSYDWARFFHYKPAQILLTLLVAIVLQLIIRGTTDRIVRRVVRGHKHASAVEERKREQTVIGIFHTASAVIIWITAGIVILSELHVNIAALLTGAGVLGVVFGLGAQSTLKDYIAGVFIIMENQYRVGDIVTLGTNGEVSGVVEDITIRITKLRDLDGNLHIVRNGDIGTITNRSFQFANVNVDLNVSYSSDIAKVEKVINEVGKGIAEDEKWCEIVLEPIKFLRVDSFNEWSVTVKSLGKVLPGNQWDVAGEFRLRIKKAFEKNGIEIPLPQRVVRQIK